MEVAHKEMRSKWNILFLSLFFLIMEMSTVNWLWWEEHVCWDFPVENQQGRC